MVEFSLVAVFLVGLLSGVHCLGMCGSIVGVFTAQAPKDAARWPFHLAYSSGRIMSYAMAGALVGAVGQAGLLMRDGRVLPTYDWVAQPEPKSWSGR